MASKVYSYAVTETSYGFIEVVADSVDEANKIANREYENGNTVWSNYDYTIERED